MVLSTGLQSSLKGLSLSVDCICVRCCVDKWVADLANVVEEGAALASNGVPVAVFVSVVLRFIISRRFGIVSCRAINEGREAAREIDRHLMGVTELP